jgi:hypothetical protein
VAAASGSFEEEGRGKLYYVIGAVAALLFIIILFVAFSGDQDAGAPEAAGTPPGTVLQAAPKLSESPLLHPERPIGAARNVAGAAEERNQEMEEAQSGEETGS